MFDSASKAVVPDGAGVVDTPSQFASLTDLPRSAPEVRAAGEESMGESVRDIHVPPDPIQQLLPGCGTPTPGPSPSSAQASSEGEGRPRAAKRIKTLKSLPYADAVEIADEFVALMAGTFKRVQVGDCIRRRVSKMPSIHILFDPEFGPSSIAGDEPRGWESQQLRRVLDLIASDQLQPSPERFLGPKFQKVIFNGALIEVTCRVGDASWGVKLMQVTGSERYWRMCVTQVDKGGWLPNDMRIKHGCLLHRGDVIDVPDEKSFFNATGILPRRPEDRR